MIGQPIADLEKATEIPSGSSYLANMGDGSGTKLVPREVLTKEVGKGLKVGDLAELQTEDKSSLVAAINEAAQSGGSGSAVDILDTKEEIEANTETGKAAGAQAVKAMFGELNDNLSIGEWNTINITNNGNGEVKYRKARGFVEVIITGWGASSLNIGTYEAINLCTLPEEYRPDINISFAVSSQVRLAGSITTDGKIIIQNCENSEKTAYYVYGSVLFAK